MLQTFTNLEIIAVDDCSPDLSAKILETYKKKDSRIKIITHEKNLGTLLARKTAMEAAIGDYILFLDSDDYLEPDACAKLYNVLKESTCDILEFGYTSHPTGAKIYPDVRIDDRLGLLFSESNPLQHTLWNKAYRRELVKTVQRKIEPLYIVYVDDCYLAVLFNAFSKSVSILKEFLHNYNSFAGVSSERIITEKQVLKFVQYLGTLEIGLSKFINECVPERISGLKVFLSRLIGDFYYRVTCNYIPASVQKKYVAIIDRHFKTNYTMLLSKKFDTPFKRFYYYMVYKYHCLGGFLKNFISVSRK